MLIITLCAFSLGAQTLKAYVLESEPLGFIEEGKPSGEHYDYLIAIAERAGVDLDVEVVPKSKLFGAVKSGEIDMAIFFRASKWDKYVDYCSAIREINIIAMNKKGLPLNSYSDLHNSKRVGVIAKTSISADFDNDAGIVKYSVPNYETMLKMLNAGRIDSGVGNAIVLSYLINKYGYASKLDDGIVSLGTNTQWLQFSKKSAHLDLIPKFREAISELKSEGKLDEILTSYAGGGWQELNGSN